MQEQFEFGRTNLTALSVIETANQICADYRTQGYDLTLRQLYYQFVAKDLFPQDRTWRWTGSKWVRDPDGTPNAEPNYKWLGSVINDARLRGLLDWSYIQDRGRNIAGSFGGYTDPGQFIESLASRYFEALWIDQEYRPEVWVEKEALIDIVAQGCREYHVPHYACKGYVSQSEMYDAAKRMQRRRAAGHVPLIIHLGDHDPSGIDMTRDIRDRLSLMSYGDVEVRRIALNMDQIEQYDPPPNPAKMTDSRAVGYVEEYGDESWELDALEPTVLVQLIEEELETLVDPGLWERAVRHEEMQQDRINLLASRWRDLDDHWDEVLDVIGHDV
jgi:hypothetical protein